MLQQLIEQQSRSKRQVITSKEEEDNNHDLSNNKNNNLHVSSSTTAPSHPKNDCTVIIEESYQNLDAFRIELRPKPWNQTDKCTLIEEEEYIRSNECKHPQLKQCHQVFNEPFKVLKRNHFHYKKVSYHPTYEENKPRKVVSETQNPLQKVTPITPLKLSISSFIPPEGVDESDEEEITTPKTKEQTNNEDHKFFLSLSEMGEIDTLNEEQNANNTPQITSPRNTKTSPRSKLLTFKRNSISKVAPIKTTELSGRDDSVFNSPITPKKLEYEEIAFSERKSSLVEFSKGLISKKKIDLIELIDPTITPPMTLKIDHNYKDLKLHSTNRLMGCLKPNFQYKPLDTAFCQKIRGLSYPVKRKTKFFLQCTSFRFENQLMREKELLYCTIALYDVLHEKKISEDYHFHTLTNEQLQQLPNYMRDYLKFSSEEPINHSSGMFFQNNSFTTQMPKKLFSVSYPNDQIYLVVFVYRMPSSSVKDSLKPYLKEMKDMKKWENQYNEKKKKLFRFRQPFLFGFTPLFTKETIDYKGKTIDTYTLLSYRYDIKPLYELDLSNPIDIISILKSIQKEKKLKNQVVGASLLFHAELISNSSTTSNLELQMKLQNKQTKFGSLSSTSSRENESLFGNTLSLQGEHKELQKRSLSPRNNSSLGSSTFSHGTSPYEMQSSPLRSSHLYENQQGRGSDSSDTRSVDSDRKLSSVAENDFNKELINEQFQVQEMPCTPSNYPNLVLQNTLFIYPIFAQLEKVKGAKNILIEVLLREKDDTLPRVNDYLLNAEKRIISIFKKDRSCSIISSVSYDNKEARFIDEFRIELPLIPKPKQHLLFIFYHVDIDNKKSSKLQYANQAQDMRIEDFGTSERAIIGYSFLPLTKKIEFENTQFSSVASYTLDLDLQTELPIFREDTFGSKYLTNAEKYETIKHGKFELKATIITTIHHRDEVINLFIATITDLYVAPNSVKDNILRFLLQSVLPRFNQIHFDQFLPHLPVMMNLLFELLCKVSSITRDVELRTDVERATLISILISLKGCYHFTKHHTRANKFLSSYVKYNFDNVPSCIPVFIALTRCYIDLLKSPVKQETEPYFDGKYIEEIKQRRGMGGRRSSFSSNDKDKKEYEHRKNELTSYDHIRFSWFIFDVIIKSIVLCGAVMNDEESYSKNYFRDASEESFMELLKELVLQYNSTTQELVRSDGGKANIAINGNRNLSLFIRDLIPIISRKNLIFTVKTYFDSLPSSRNLRFKCEFLAILTDYNYHVPLNNLQLEGSNFLIKHFTTTFYEAVETKKERTIKRMCKILLNHFCKLDYDMRYLMDEKKAEVCELYLDFIDPFFEKDDEYLFIFQNDELFIVISVCILWVIRGLSKSKLIQWFTSQPFYKIINILTFFDFLIVAVNNLDYDSNKVTGYDKDDRILRTEVTLVMCYLINILTSKQALIESELLKKLEKQNESISMLENVHILDNHSLMRQKQLISLFEAKDSKQQKPAVGLFLRHVCRLIMNSILQTTLKKETEICYLLFKDTLVPLLTNFINEIVLSELYDENIPKKERIPLAQKRRSEQKWRWLLGAVMLHSGFTSEEESRAHEIISTCEKLLLSPFLSKSITNNNDNQSDERGDVIINFDDQNVKGATFKKLVERLLEIDVHPNDFEGTKFGDIFILTCASFTSPVNLIEQLWEIFMNTQNAVIKLRIEQFVSKWVRFGFHDFDNMACARLVCFLKHVSSSTQKKIKKYVVKHFMNVKMETDFDSTKKPPNPSIPKNIPRDKIENPKIDIKLWKSQRYVNAMQSPFEIKFELLDWPTIEIARQMTLIESKLFRKIEPKEFFGGAWADEYKQELAPTLCSIAERTNNVSFWVRNKILNESNIETRRKIMKKFVDILRELKEMRNYMSILEITSAFNSAEIHRLKRTKEILTRQDLELIEECSNLVNNNSKVLRELLEREVIMNDDKPAVPAISIYFTDLVFTEEGNPSYLNHETNPNKKLINFHKRRLYYNIVNLIKTLQTKAKYNFQPLPYLQYVLKEEIFENMLTDEKNLFELSLQVEPRK
ncbi:hypothetical protein ABK040_013834 [Willaertia magna]